MKTMLSCFVVLAIVGPTPVAAELPSIVFKQGEKELRVLADDLPVATYVFRDDQISRPYFAHVRAPGGIQVTRNHPPIEGQDALDHATLHPGIWLAFGDISGHDYWRLKAKVQHREFVKQPVGKRGEGTFTVLNHYLSSDGTTVVCQEVASFTFVARPDAYLLLWDSEFSSDRGDFAFGDQEEMGLGVRLATAIAVRDGTGAISNSDGQKNESGVWGKQANWCDYSGTIDKQCVGVTIMPDPANFGPCWYHARDYGFVAANPFGRNAFTRGEKSEVVVAKGNLLRLRFGLLIHSTDSSGEFDIKASYEDFLARLKE